jgi:hypothetical protein
LPRVVRRYTDPSVMSAGAFCRLKNIYAVPRWLG